MYWTLMPREYLTVAMGKSTSFFSTNNKFTQTGFGFRKSQGSLSLAYSLLHQALLVTLSSRFYTSDDTLLSNGSLNKFFLLLSKTLL
jgi:hypothetical protein